MQSKRHYSIWGHDSSHQSGKLTNPKPVRDFLLAINTNSHPILHHIQIIAD